MRGLGTKGDAPPDVGEGTPEFEDGVRKAVGKTSGESPEGQEEDPREDAIGPAVTGEGATRHAKTGVGPAIPAAEQLGHTCRYLSHSVSPGRRVWAASRTPGSRNPGASSSHSKVIRGTKQQSRAMKNLDVSRPMQKATPTSSAIEANTFYMTRVKT